MITISSSFINTSSSCRLNNSFWWTTFKAKWCHKSIHLILLQVLMECSRCNIRTKITYISRYCSSLECFKASSSSKLCNCLETITTVECNFLISNSINSQISFRFGHLKTCIHMNQFNKVDNSFILNLTFSENKQVILVRLKNKTLKKQNMSPQKQQKMQEKETNW